MRCPSCNHDNRAERRFCAECGAALAALCGACGASNEHGEKFCGGCGARLQTTAPAIAGPPPAPEPEAALPAGERRQLTVLFCDLVGSTPLSQQLDAEEWRDLIAQYQKAAAGAVGRFGGHVAKNLGDGLLIYFGWPTAREDDPERAVRAGLAIVDALVPLNATLAAGDGTRLAVRIGMHTGPVVIADGGEVFGETANVAARVQGAAEPDTVVITAATQHLVAGLFIVEERQSQPLKGVDRPLTLYRVLQPSGVRGRLAAAAPHGLTPFVGRTHERELLRQRWTQARGGEGQVVLVTGEAGIGKSRLVQMLKEDLASAPHSWIECSGSPYHQNTPFFAVTDMLQQVLAWRGDEDRDERLASLEQALTRAGLPVTDVLPLVAPLLSLPVPERYPKSLLSPEAQRRETLRTLAAWLFASAHLQPVVAVLEDLHWVDPSTLELQARLVEHGANVPLLLLYTARPEFRVPWPLLGHHTQLPLSRLGTAEVRAMIESVAARTTLSEDVMQTVVKRTDGVPLFVEELTKTVLGAPDTGAIPTTLEDSLRARLDRLGSAKDVAQIGAVIGREFSYALVRAVVGTRAGGRSSEADLHAALGKLTDGDLLYVRGVPPAATYIFKHALVQDSAYASLLRSRRRALHAAIAAVLTEQFPDVVEAQPELMAHHYAEAGDIRQAVPHYQRAGERATQRSANEEAISHLRRALDLVSTLPETRERHQTELGLQMALGVPLAAARGWSRPEIERTYARARALASQIGESPELPRVLAQMASAYFNKGDLATAGEVAQEVLVAAERTGETSDLLLAHYAVSTPLLYQGHFSQALHHLEHSIKLYNPNAHGPLAYTVGVDRGVTAHAFAAWCHFYLGHPDRALASSDVALALAKRVEHPISLAHALYFGGVVHFDRGELDRARERAEAVVGLAEKFGFPFWLGVGRFFRGFARVESGEGEAGIAEMQQAMVELARIGSRIGASGGRSRLAEVLRKVGRHDDALRALRLGDAQAEVQGEHYYDAELHRLRAEILLETVDSQQPALSPVEGSRVASEKTAEECFQLALEIARRQEAKTFELRAATSLARLWQRQGKRQRGGRDAARDLLAPVYAWFTEGFDTRDLKEAKALLAEL